MDEIMNCSNICKCTMYAIWSHMPKMCNQLLQRNLNKPVQTLGGGEVLVLSRDSATDPDGVHGFAGWTCYFALVSQLRSFSYLSRVFTFSLLLDRIFCFCQNILQF